ncbi:hypothetical protein [Bilophila wadsworthia]|uniref:hypothetical protein n=1 Tax=Bilophila wadsworthia TaxID=35833 RepID=UPI002A8184CB|nr:hypothetical protein [Bilophila wadsworthia]MDY3681679.1 hypothetical protein [Bilophila wadsworthia]
MYEAAGRLQGAKSVWLSPIVEFGVYVINNDSLPFPHMIGRAKLALKETSTELRGRLRYAVYDDAIRRQLFREKHLENIMGAALQNREFQVYLQPDRKRNHQRRRGAGSLDERRRHDLSRRVHPAVRKERVHHPAGPLGV